MSVSRESGVTLGHIAELMQEALSPIDDEITRLEDQRKKILAAPSLLVSGAVASGHGKEVEAAVHELYQDIFDGDLASFKTNHPEAAEVDVSGYIPEGRLTLLLPEQVVELPQKESAHPLPPLAYDENPLKEEELLQKYPFLAEFFDKSHAIEFNGQKYFPRKNVAGILVHRNGRGNRIGEGEFLGRMFREWEDTLGNGVAVGALLPAKQGKGLIGLRKDEMIGFISFIDAQQLVYTIGDPSKKKSF